MVKCQEYEFLITSPGRTGTKWLAWVMNHSAEWSVGHESIPKTKNDQRVGVVAPSYALNAPAKMLHGCKIGVVLRNPEEIALSFFNYNAYLGMTAEEIEIEYLSIQLQQIVVLDKVLEDGAIAIDYHRYNDPDYVTSVCREFGINDVCVTEGHLQNKINTRPTTYSWPDEMPSKTLEFVRGPFTDYHQAWHK
tara:strand:+ start:413 stop:988 length:576 start_codon:yes stop_codon:yes gene_type:complete